MKALVAYVSALLAILGLSAGLVETPPEKPSYAANCFRATSPSFWQPCDKDPIAWLLSNKSI